MIVGFTITNFNGHEADAVRFIQSVCILERPEIAENIVRVGVGVNVYSFNLTRALLDSQPFSTTPIETRDGNCLMVSNVDYLLEFSYLGNIVRLEPTQFIYVPYEDVPQFKELSMKRFVKFIPDANTSLGNRIFETGFWDDNGFWIDSLIWEED